MSDDEDRKFKSHVLSMKRTQQFVKEELQFIWSKTDGNDHSMFALVYLYIACLLRGTVAPTNSGFAGLISAFKVKNR